MASTLKHPSPKLPRSVKRLFPKVATVTDATSRVSVMVTQRDSSQGKRLNATECAMARAAKRDFNADGIVIGLSRSYIIKGNKALRFATPSNVAREIISFDRHHDFAPGKYELIPVAPTQRLGESKNPDRDHGSPDRVRRVHKGTVRVRFLDSGVER